MVTTVEEYDSSEDSEKEYDSSEDSDNETDETDETDLSSDFYSNEQKENEAAKSNAEIPVWSDCVCDMFSTSNATVAVQGFLTKDDDRICKFRDPETGGCYKKGGCNLSHDPTIEDGSFADQKPIFYDNLYETKALPRPQKGSVVDIEITTFESTNKFWCRYSKQANGGGFSDLDALMAELNSSKEIASYKPLTGKPTEMQLVIVKGNDGRFFRGRVGSLAEDDQTVNVLLVDYGVFEDISMAFIFEYASLIALELEFQTFEMEIANVQTSKRIGAVQFLNKFINLKKFKATIVNEERPVVTCKLSCGFIFDFGEFIVLLNIAKAREVALPSSGDSQYILG